MTSPLGIPLPPFANHLAIYMFPFNVITSLQPAHVTLQTHVHVQEAKVTNVMNLELADYQRSLQSLEEKLAAGQRELEQARDEGRKQQDKMDTMRKEIGECYL